MISNKLIIPIGSYNHIVEDFSCEIFGSILDELFSQTFETDSRKYTAFAPALQSVRTPFLLNFKPDFILSNPD
jgi:hypothetical protein